MSLSVRTFLHKNLFFFNKMCIFEAYFQIYNREHKINIMKTDVNQKKPTVPFKDKPWDITPESKKHMCEKRIKEILNCFNQVNVGRGYFFMIDYTEDRIILNDSSTRALTGFAPLFIKQGPRHKFYEEILEHQELIWYYKMIESAHTIFFQHPIDVRKHFEIAFDFIISDTTNREFTFRHKIMPYQLDRNGNMWLGLGFVTAYQGHLKTLAKAIMMNTKTGDQYFFIDDEFVLSNTKVLTNEDIQILKWFAEDQTREQICDILYISESTFKRKRKAIFEKLNVQTATGAVHKAGTMGLL
jgi:DNA-binding CsgD family transcriptional regulator